MTLESSLNWCSNFTFVRWTYLFVESSIDTWCRLYVSLYAFTYWKIGNTPSPAYISKQTCYEDGEQTINTLVNGHSSSIFFISSMSLWNARISCHWSIRDIFMLVVALALATRWNPRLVFGPLYGRLRMLGWGCGDRPVWNGTRNIVCSGGQEFRSRLFDWELFTKPSDVYSSVMTCYDVVITIEPL
jgi:hypothetical protein